MALRTKHSYHCCIKTFGQNIMINLHQQNGYKIYKSSTVLRANDATAAN